MKLWMTTWLIKKAKKHVWMDNLTIDEVWHRCLVVIKRERKGDDKKGNRGIAPTRNCSHGI